MKLQELRFGVELETVKRERETVAKAIQSVVGGEVSHVAGSSSYDPWEVRDDKNRVWKVVADSSLGNVAAHLRAEIVTPVLCYEDIPDLQEVVRAVRKCGAQVDEKCGLHVHVGTEEFGGKALTNLAKTFYKYEPLIIAALGVSEQRMRQYTKPLSDEFITRLGKLRTRTRDQVNKAWYGHLNNHPTRYCSSRYVTMNLNSVFYRGTVEFRLFEGTLHAGKVKAAIQFVLAICAKALNSRGASSRKRDFDPETAKYDFRVFLIHLSMIGDEFKTARKHLLHAMPGDAVFKRGRPKSKAAKVASEMEVCCGTNGIRVADSGMASVLNPGDIVTIYDGDITTVDGERVINSYYTEFVSSGTSPATLGLVNKALGGGSYNVLASGPVGGFGLNNVGLLVRAWGKICNL